MSRVLHSFSEGREPEPRHFLFGNARGAIVDI